MTVDGTNVYVAFPKTEENHTRSLLNGYLIEMGGGGIALSTRDRFLQYTACRVKFVYENCDM